MTTMKRSVPEPLVPTSHKGLYSAYKLSNAVASQHQLARLALLEAAYKG
jgi:hypothetical protein